MLRPMEGNLGFEVVHHGVLPLRVPESLDSGSSGLVELFGEVLS